MSELQFDILKNMRRALSRIELALQCNEKPDPADIRYIVEGVEHLQDQK